MDRADALVLDAVQKAAMMPVVVERIVDGVIAWREERRRARSAQPERLEQELKKARRARDRFLDAIAAGNAPASIIERIRALDATISGLEAQLKQRQPRAVPPELESARLKRDIRARVEKFSDLLKSNVPIARQALRKLLDGPISFDATSGTYVLRGKTRAGALLTCEETGVKKRLYSAGAEEGTRTPTMLPPPGPEPGASTNSATSAGGAGF